MKMPVYILIFISLFSAAAGAQSFKATARTDVSEIKIGEQFKLILEVQSPPGYKFSFPMIPDTITKLEIIKRSGIDTADLKDKNLYSYTQTFTITCFDSGYYPIPPFEFSYRQSGDTSMHNAETEAMLISVMGIPVDTSQNIRDIKMPLKAPFSLREAIPYILAATAVVLLVLLSIYLSKKYRKKHGAAPSFTVIKRPPHEIAIEELKKLEGERLWQQGLTKQYHSRVTDIIRTYIEHRFGIIAMEMTTGEIMQSVRNLNFDAGALEKLSHLLTIADMVKFAKVLPLPGENEMSMQHSYEFINMTREVKTEIPEPQKEITAV